MNGSWGSLKALAGALGMVALVIWLLVFWWRRSDDRPALLVRWLITLAGLLVLVLVIGPLVSRFDYVAAFIGIPAAAVVGLVFATVWAPEITESVGRKFAQLYDGGNVPADPEPFFSIAEARRKAGRIEEAVAELRKQLVIFPTHFRGLMLLAEIQADDLHDVEAAAATIEQLLQQPSHSPKNLAFALTRLADWQLKHRRDPAAARASLERIIAAFPDSPEAHHASQRIAHLPTPEFLASQTTRAPIKLTHHEERLGLRPDFQGLKPPAPDLTARSAELVRQLEQFPLDNEAREELALLYATGFHRLDLATEQLEQLIAQPHAPQQRIVYWLNLLADLQARETGDLALARQTLQRVVDRFPNSPAADAAKRRIPLLAPEAATNKTGQALPLGPYKARSPQSPPPESEGNPGSRSN
ncbi:MAG TPA: tetratricopeptide repeat protein [Verrucomicrobiota bacterium]|nr:tetratricopeptide repeat protein [Verrucomicrobiota bacterium]HNU50885.1 tetratricopeptide repeat protein [Verrucomicrobiota bacterium]